MTIRRIGIELEIAGVNDREALMTDDQSASFRNGMADPNRLDRKRARLESLPHRKWHQTNLSRRKTSLQQPLARQSKRMTRTMDRYVKHP